ncbi:MAG: carboxypeptidase regulatory-like domain-containing protein [Candidatus Aminicenantes bacterium]|nr:carboxypeptidase regulatory-like domain-containing protein [Candidatus Aminicenantes bacterium]
MKTKNIKIINVIVYVVVFGGLFFGMAAGIQAKLVSVGILAFHDESGTGVPGELGPKISRDLQQKLVKSYPDLLPRVFAAEVDATAVTGMTVPQLAAYGKEQGVDFLVRGGLLAISAANIDNGVQVSVELYAEIISSELSTVKSVRASGVGAQRVVYPSYKVPWEAIDLSGGEFQYSAPGLAIINAVEQLAGAVHEAVVSPIEEQVMPAKPIAPQETAPAPDSEDAQQTGEVASQTGVVNEEELQQLISQAEELTYNSTVSPEKLTALSQALEKLKGFLNSKVSLMEQGEDTSGIDQDIYGQKEELRQIIAQVTEEVSSGQQTTEGSQDSQVATGEKKNLLAGIGGYLDDSLNIIQKIQELRATLKGDSGAAQGEAAAADAAAEPGTETGTAADSAPAMEESGEEVSGVVTEGGEPVEGVTVTDPETGVTATTDSSGFYNLGKIPAGRFPELVVSKGGKTLAMGKLDLPPGRSAVADWELKSKFSSSKTPTLRVMPSLVNVSAGKTGVSIIGTGTIKGVVLDVAGKPMPRVLVKLGNMGSVRTNSRGEYVFLRVPPGTYQVTVMQGGFIKKSQQVGVAARGSSVQTIRFTPQDIIVKQPVLPALIVRGTATDLWGKVSDEKDHPVAGAKVTIIKAGRAISVSTLASGKYLLKDLQPGTYRVLVSKPGFKSSSCDISLKAGKTQKLFFKLEEPSPYIRKILGQQHAKGKPVIVQTVPRAGKTVVIVPHVVRPAPMVNGRLTGRVITAGTGKPIAGATISIAGRGSVASGPGGGYSFMNLPPGTYQVSVGRIGFSGSSRTITIKSGQTVAVDFALPLRLLKLRKN